MEGCLKSAFVALSAGSCAERGPLYVAFFNFSVGLERLLKLTLALNHRVQNHGNMPTRKTLKDFGHDVAELYAASEMLLPSYGVCTSDTCRLDAIDRRLLMFLSGFAILGRYFNLDALTGAGNSEDPLPEWWEILNEIYEKDVPEFKRISNEEQVDALAASLKDVTFSPPHTGLDGDQQSFEERYQDHGKMKLVRPEVAWRLMKILLPIERLMWALSVKLHEEMAELSNDIPDMEEFLGFVCSDKQ